MSRSPMRLRSSAIWDSFASGYCRSYLPQGRDGGVIKLNALANLTLLEHGEGRLDDLVFSLQFATRTRNSKPLVPAQRGRGADGGRSR